MKRIMAIVAACLYTASLVGCGSRKQPSAGGAAPSAVPGQAAAPAAAAPIPSSEATGYWNQAQVETYLKEELKLAEVSLTRAGGENYTGVGKGTDGQSYALNVKQAPGGIVCEFQTDTGGGRIAFGNAAR